MISVLLVDDEPALLDIAEIFLEKTGLFKVGTCLSGSQALALLVKNRYDVIVSDYEMPEMDGISLIRTLKQQGDRTPFIIFTGKGSEQVVIDALNNGAAYYLQKGCNPKAQFAELSDKCRLAVQQRQSETALKESEEKYQALIKHAPEGILILDMQGTILLANNAGYGVFILSGDHILYANPYFTTMTGHSPEALEQLALWDLIHPDFREKCKEIISGVQKTGTTPADHKEVTLIATDGVEYQVLLGIIPVVFENKPAILGTVLDLTGQRNAESRLERINKKLHLVNEVTHHDLLNNFTALFGYFEIIRHNTTDPHNLEFMKKQEFILSAIREQIDFTGYYLDIGNARPRWQLVEHTIHEAASMLPLGPQVLNLALGETEILADPLLIRVFYNLMENSLRHGEHITEIRFYGEKRPDGFFIIYEDNGIGVPAKNKERIFIKGMGKNSGLGLFLIKEILAITKMTIRETGEPGKGVRFEIFVPEGMFRLPSS